MNILAACLWEGSFHPPLALYPPGTQPVANWIPGPEFNPEIAPHPVLIKEIVPGTSMAEE